MGFDVSYFVVVYSRESTIMHMPMYSLLARFWMTFSSTAAMSGKVSVPREDTGPTTGALFPVLGSA